MPPEHDPSREPSIRTMKTDAEELSRQEKTSFLDLFSKGQVSRAPLQYNPVPKRRRNWARIFSIIFVVLAVCGAAFGGAYYYLNKKPVTPAPNTKVEIPRPFINAFETKKISTKAGDRTGILGELESRQKEGSVIGDYVYIPLFFYDFGKPEYVASPKDFFDILRMTPPTDLLGTLTNRWNLYLYGGSYVLVMETADRMKTWDQMKSWEERIGEDFRPLVTSTTPGEHPFKDMIIKNVDVRISRLSDTSDSVIAHAIVLGKFAIVATSEKSLRATIDRLVAGPIIQ
jgi:hypothetical protein